MRRRGVRAAPIIAEIRSELERATWFHEKWVDDVLGQIERNFDDACERWRSLYRAAVRQRKLHHDIIGDHSRPEAERNHSRRLRAQAEAQIRLLTEAEGIYEGDFYSYRYFATEGFLPGYNFPGCRSRRSYRGDGGSRGRDEFISRPRFLAVSEFGPACADLSRGGALSRVQGQPRLRFGRGRRYPRPHHRYDEALPAMRFRSSRGGRHQSERGLRSLRYAALDVRIDGLVAHAEREPSREVQRITCDEEERQRFGYRLVTAYRFPEVNGQLDLKDAEVHCRRRPDTYELSYGDATDLYRINLGWGNQDAITTARLQAGSGARLLGAQPGRLP